MRNIDNNDWQKKIIHYCDEFNIPIKYLRDILNEPKVIPMIRGKAFEFSVMVTLQRILSKNDWKVDKFSINAQTGFHDVDVRIAHLKSKKIIKVECKLAKKQSYRLHKDGHSEIRVKCMRSRTLGPGMIKILAPKLKIESKILAVHNDQYLPTDFDVVVTSIGNSFYRTNLQTGAFEFLPNKIEIEFLKKLGFNGNDLRAFAFNQIYIAHSRDLVIGSQREVKCTRKNCNNQNLCGFIPNYPIIYFDKNTNLPTNGWIALEKAETIFSSFIKNL